MTDAIFMNASEVNGTVIIAGAGNGIRLGSDQQHFNTLIYDAPASTNHAITFGDPMNDDNVTYVNSTQTLTNKSIKLATSGQTAATLNYYEEYQMTLSLDGCFASAQSCKK